MPSGAALGRSGRVCWLSGIDRGVGRTGRGPLNSVEGVRPTLAYAVLVPVVLKVVVSTARQLEHGPHNLGRRVVIMTGDVVDEDVDCSSVGGRQVGHVLNVRRVRSASVLFVLRDQDGDAAVGEGSHVLDVERVVQVVRTG